MEQYTKYRSTVIADLQNKIGYYAAYMQKAVAANEKWKTAGEVKSAVNTLKNWLEKRLQWLDSQWLLDPTEVAPHKITVTTNGKGSVAPSDGVSKVANGSYKIYTITPESGYTISSVKMNGRDVTDEVTLGVYTTPYITKDGTLEVVFKQSGAPAQPSGTEYSLFVDGNIQNGTVSLSVDSAPEGTAVTVTATADDGYALESITVDSVALTSDTFVMPARDVLVSAVFKAIVATQDNKDALYASVGIADTATMKAISNLSATEISDTYTNLIVQAEAILDDDDASPDLIDSVSVELLRMFGIMNRKEIGAKQLNALADTVALTGAASSAVEAARSAASGGDAQAAVSAWDALIDAYYAVPTNTLLESLCSTYGTFSESDYTQESFAAFGEALRSGKLVLEKASATQSEIDAAAAQLAYAGRNLIRVDAGEGSANAADKTVTDISALKNTVMVSAIVLAVVAAVLLAVALIKVIRRKQNRAL